MGDGRAQHPREVVQEGEQIQARIIRIDPQRKRMGLSMRQAGEGDAPPVGDESSEALGET
jgi:small subunit ribosomal protein S1